MIGRSDSFSAGREVEAPRTTQVERRTVEPTLFDPSKPSIARVYDYWLGGKDNFPADRAEAERLIAIYPQLPFACPAEQTVPSPSRPMGGEARRHAIPRSRLRIAHQAEHS